MPTNAAAATFDAVKKLDTSQEHVLEQPAESPNCRGDILETRSWNQIECVSQSLFSLLAGCRDCVCDCVHRVEALNIERQSVEGVQICSAGYHRRRGRLEI